VRVDADAIDELVGAAGCDGFGGERGRGGKHDEEEKQRRYAALHRPDYPAYGVPRKPPRRKATARARWLGRWLTGSLRALGSEVRMPAQSRE
jgi:hypothetical protein